MREDATESSCQSGYTLIEILGVAAIMVIVVLSVQGMTINYKRFTIEENTVQRLKQLSRYQTIFRNSNDPALNPDNSYGTFFDLQTAGLIPEIYDQSDERRHTVNAFVPNYRLEFMRSRQQDEVEPDQFNYLIMAIPLYNPMNLRTFFMQEDGEVYWERFIYRQQGKGAAVLPTPFELDTR